MRSSARFSRSGASPTGKLWLPGCGGVLLGLALGGCALIFLLFATTLGSLPAIAPADPTQPDMTVVVRETYFAHVLGQSLPPNVAQDLQIDVQPGNRLALSGQMQVNLLGQTLNGNLAATLTLGAKDGRLVVGITDVNVMGFALPQLAEGFVDGLATTISGVLDQQVKAGLGEDVTITGVTTDDRQVTILARWP